MAFYNFKLFEIIQLILYYKKFKMKQENKTTLESHQTLSTNIDAPTEMSSTMNSVSKKSIINIDDYNKA